jgi:hypothetical protein
MLYIVVLCVMSMYAHAIDDQALFAQATKAYDEQQFAAAEEQFLSIADKSPAVWYNAGNAAFQLHGYGNAMLYWLRAARTTDVRLYRDSMHNIAYLRERLGYTISPQERVYFYCKLITCYLPLLLVHLLLIALWMLMLWLWQHKLLHRWFLLCISLLSILVMLMTWICRPEKDRAVVIVQQASLYAGPNSSFYQLASVQQAQIVTLLSRTPVWDKIAYNGQVGWVAHAQVEPIDQA